MRTASVECAIVVHGGADAGRDLNDGCQAAADAARSELNNGDALGAAVAAVVSMENDGRFNAGTGAALGLDGKTVEMDACVMDTQGRLGAVTLLRGVKNPVLVARQIANTPHCLLGGEGAERFARAMGHAPYFKISDKARQQHREMMAELQSDHAAMAGVANHDFIKFWNYIDAPTFSASRATDTVGAVVRDGKGGFAVASSTGGSAPSLLGRVGDTPLIGCGFYAGPHGAVAATGVGEYMIRTMLAARVYQWISDGVPVDDALARSIGLFPREVPIGLIAVSETEAAALSNADMPQCRLQFSIE